MTVVDEAKVFVNGEYVSGKLELMHSDRLASPPGRSDKIVTFKIIYL